MSNVFEMIIFQKKDVISSMSLLFLIVIFQV